MMREYKHSVQDEPKRRLMSWSCPRRLPKSSYSTSKHCPTAMIFIPSRDGVSHNPVEYSSPEQV